MNRFSAGYIEIAGQMDAEVSSTKGGALTTSPSIARTPRVTQRDEIRLLLADGSVRRASALRAAGIRPQAIADALTAGLIARTAVGTYYVPGASSEPDLVDLAAAVAGMPRAIVCLTSAAGLCGLDGSASLKLWLALPVGAHPAKSGKMPRQLLRWSHSGAFEVGIATKEICGVAVRYTDAARTVVDLLRYRRHFSDAGGIEVGVRAVRRFIADGGQPSTLLQMAEVLRASKKTRQAISTLSAAFG